MQIFRDLHIGSGSLHRILEHAAQELGPLMLGHTRHIHAVDLNGAEIRLPHAGDGILQGGLAGAVAADDGDKVAFLDVQVQTIQSGLGIDGARVKGLLQIGDLKHRRYLPSGTVQ